MADENGLQELLEKLIDSKTDPGEIHVCPICGGELQVGFGAYQRGNRVLFGATADCRSCDAGIAIDYAGPPPTWVK